MNLLRITMITGCAVALLTLSATAATNSFQLQVNDVSGLATPWPLVGGLPFPEGELRDPARIRIVNAQGEEVPAQIDVTATWPDGSVRWALAGIHASPRGTYHVEYGDGVSRSAPAHPLKLEQTDDGAITVDTNAAVYEFAADRLLPESGRMGETLFLDGAGDGAYLIDNHGRLARVAGADAEIDTEILKQGPVRTVVRRAGWYVTPQGERVARAKAWFYFTAGSPFVRITHSIVFTKDTNELWVRDYGLEFRTPDSPDEAAFALSEATWTDRYYGGGVPDDEQKHRALAEMFSTGLAEREQTLFTADPSGDELYMLQENYPHVVERKFRAVIGRSSSPLMSSGSAPELENLWVHPWLKEFEVAGDWAEARYDDHALGVVMPQLAQRFPKEIAVGPNGVRAALWSGRSARELDFRAATLVNEYWKDWTHRAFKVRRGLGDVEPGPPASAALAGRPSNAQGAARTHDVWLLPRTDDVSDAQLKARGLAAAHPPLLQADPAWLGDSKAVGWPMHQKDTDRFPETERRISEQWERALGQSYGNAGLRRAGFIMWGKNATLGTAPRWFRLSQGSGHYKLDLNAWLLYARSGERRYYDYGRHFTRFAGDMSVHHWTVGNRFRGGFASPNVDLPFYWHGESKLPGRLWTLGWMMHYHMTGDEYANELLDMVADAYRHRAGPDSPLAGYKHGHLYNLSILYQHTQDETIGKLARKAAYMLIDLDNPIGLNDDLRYGAYYKTSTEWLFPLYLYYNATGDETARKVILRALDDKFRLFYTSNQTFRLFLFAEAYRWTGNRAYLRLINLMLEEPHFSLMGHNYFLGAPAALHAIANADKPIGPHPVLAVTRREDSVARSAFFGEIMDHQFIEAGPLPPIMVDKAADTPVNLSIYVRVPDEKNKDTVPTAMITRAGSNDAVSQVNGVRIEKSRRFETKSVGRRTPRRWHFTLTLPAEAEAGRYRIEFPDVATIIVLESDAPDVSLGDDGE